MNKITKKDKLDKIMNKYPQLAETLMVKYGLHCLGCYAAAFETLEQGAKAHGMSNKEIEKMVKELNNIKTQNSKPKFKSKKVMNQQLIINKAIVVLKSGGVIILPTDTVWGIGCLINNIKAVKRLYKIKKREVNKPTAVLIGSLTQAKKIGYFNKNALTLAKKYWPGALTIIVKAKTSVPKIILGKNKTIGLRIPNHKLLLEILSKLESGVATASANFSGATAPDKLSAVNPNLKKLADLVVKGKTGQNLASTVIDTTSKPYKIIRQGTIVINNPIIK